ncbi:hypothetical protein K439DRAFT_1659748, partial [Ramaria rubella]
MNIGMVTLSARRRAGGGKTKITCRESIRHRTRVVQDVGTAVRWARLSAADTRSCLSIIYSSVLTSVFPTLLCVAPIDLLVPSLFSGFSSAIAVFVCFRLSSSTYQSSSQHSLGLLSLKAKVTVACAISVTYSCSIISINNNTTGLCVGLSSSCILPESIHHIHSNLQTPYFSLLRTLHFLFHPLASSFALALHIATRSSSPSPLFIIYSPLCYIVGGDLSSVRHTERNPCPCSYLRSSKLL